MHTFFRHSTASALFRVSLWVLLIMPREQACVFEKRADYRFGTDTAVQPLNTFSTECMMIMGNYCYTKFAFESRHNTVNDSVGKKCKIINKSRAGFCHLSAVSHIHDKALTFCNLQSQ